MCFPCDLLTLALLRGGVWGVFQPDNWAFDSGSWCYSHVSSFVKTQGNAQPAPVYHGHSKVRAPSAHLLLLMFKSSVSFLYTVEGEISRSSEIALTVKRLYQACLSLYSHKALWEKEKLLVMSNIIFSHSALKRLVLQTQGLVWERVKIFSDRLFI